MAKYFSRFSDPDLTEGEITPAYAALGLRVIRQIHACAPTLRLIYLIRNPLERAWSSALMALHRAEMTTEEASDQWFIDHFRSAGSRRRGDYERAIRTWRAVFGAEALLILRYEAIAAAPQELLAACFSHIGVEPVPPSDLATWRLRERVFPGPGEPIRPSLRPILADLYAKRIESLAAYLGWDLSAWTC